jgi:hypothetical protein
MSGKTVGSGTRGTLDQVPVSHGISQVIDDDPPGFAFTDQREPVRW